MKKQLLRIALYSITVYLFISAFNSTFASPFHHEHSANNRRYARTLTNLNVGEPRTVRMIYFLGNDRSVEQDIDAKLDRLIKRLQQFYANEMERHGFGRKTFRFETDTTGNAVVHHVIGQFASSHYLGYLGGEADLLTIKGNVMPEITAQFDMSMNIYFVVVDVGRAVGGIAGEYALITTNGCDDTGADYFILSAHELGHAFGLPHDFRNDAYIMSYGFRHVVQLSKCDAEWLDVHRYFNDGKALGNTPTTIQMLSPLEYPPNAIRLSFTITDADGLHQARLITPGFADASGFADARGLQGCKFLNGKKSKTIEFITTELPTNPSNMVSIGVIDVHGNVTWQNYSIRKDDVRADVNNRVDINNDGVIDFDDRLPATLRKVSGDNQHILPNSWSANPLVVEVLDANGKPIVGVEVKFRIPKGTFTDENPRTDSSGLARSFLKLGYLYDPLRIFPHNFVNVSVPGVSSSLTFTAYSREQVLVDQSERPPLYWIDTKMRNLFGPGMTHEGGLANGATSVELDVQNFQIYWTEETYLSEAYCSAIKRASMHPHSTSGEILATISTGEILDIAIDTAESKLYWTNSRSGIQSANLDGSNIQDLITGLDSPRDIAVDVVGRQLYWTERSRHIRYADIDGSNIKTLATDLGTLGSITVAGQKLYWTEQISAERGKIRRANLNGTNIEDLVALSSVPVGIAVDITDSKLYWTEMQGRIRRADLGGSNIENIVTGLIAPGKLALDSSLEANVLIRLKHQTHLTTLSLSNENISDISPVAGLANLTTLNLKSNHISDISALAGLTKLTKLILSYNNISDISPAAALANLTTLHLESNNISDISALAELTKLTELALGSNNISDFSVLVGLTNLTLLSLESNNISDISVLAGLTNLETLGLNWNNISDISALAGLTELTSLSLYDNNISDISALVGVTNLTYLSLESNNISDISHLVANTGLARGDDVLLWGNPLDYSSIYTHIPSLRQRGVTVEFDNRTPTSIIKISGTEQQAAANTALPRPFVVEVRDERNRAFEGVPVTFAVTVGGGKLSAARTTTDENGWAQSILTLGPNSGTNTVTVSVTEIQRKQTFNAKGIGTPKKLEIVSGDEQEGLPGAGLDAPFVVEVRDPSDKPVAGVEVSFSVTSGGGTLSVTSATTDSDGRAESILTLGPNPGTNTVEVTVTGVQGKQTFTAEGVQIPKTFVIISGSDQEGSPGAALTNPFVVEVKDQSDSPLSGVEVIFSVTSGGGTLSASSATTNSNGRAESTLTLGPNSGANIVTVSVAGVQEKMTFTAEGIRIPKTLTIISGDDQEGVPGSALENPFVVEVRDQSDSPLSGVEVIFSVTSGGGTLSASSATTNSNGRAESILTLGPNPGANTVTVSVAGIQEQQTFNAEGIRIPETFVIVLGDDQQGLPRAALANPFVVEVRDQSDNRLPGVQVTFSVTSGGGTLSITSAVTDSDGRAESTLTLGPNPGANTVTVSVTGIQEGQTFNAEGIRTPKAFWIISGFDQKGTIGEALPRPIVVYVAGQSGEPFPDVEVTFTVTSGGGTLSITSAVTDGDGQAESTLTLGPDPGTNTVEVAVAGILQKQTAAAFGELPPIPEDVNRDDVVNILDLVFVASVLGTEDADLAADANGDGIVNILDLVLVAGALGNAAAPASDPQALAILTAKDVGEWVAQTQDLDLTDATLQRGVLFLEQLLAALTPENTTLLPNYPNPFNPETWIPYQLAVSAEVTLTIYDVNGAAIRRLKIGYQEAGMYHSRGRAAYWDGRNQRGEPVASGLYFYMLNAGDYSASRKMVILK